MSAGGVMKHVQVNDQSMYNGLPSTESMRHRDWCCGVHGAAKWRRGIKKGTSAARRRYGRKVIRDEVSA